MLQVRRCRSGWFSFGPLLSDVLSPNHWLLYHRCENDTGTLNSQFLRQENQFWPAFATKPTHEHKKMHDLLAGTDELACTLHTARMIPLAAR